MSKKTDLVFAGDAAGGKLDKAREPGIPVIGEEELARLREGEPLLPSSDSP